MCVARTFADSLDDARLHGASVGSAPGPGDWHALTAPTVVAQLAVDPAFGLTTSKAKAQLARYGLNALQEIRPRSAW